MGNCKSVIPTVVTGVTGVSGGAAFVVVLITVVPAYATGAGCNLSVVHADIESATGQGGRTSYEIVVDDVGVCDPPAEQ
jgi:hypothetical protein